MKYIHSKITTGSGQTAESRQQTAGLLSRAEVAQLLGVCPHTIQRLTKRGELPALVFNRRLVRYESETVHGYIRAAKGGTR